MQAAENQCDRTTTEPGPTSKDTQVNYFKMIREKPVTEKGVVNNDTINI